MIIYATKQTFDRYKLKLPKDLTPPLNEVAEAVVEKESGDKLCEWGGKLFYFDHRKCIQIVNFASKFTLFLIDVKMADMENLGDFITHYLFDLYSKDKKMTKALKRMFKEHPMMCFSKLKDRSAISTLNTTQRLYADDGYYFYEYLSEGVLHTKKINYDVNFKYIFTMKVNGKTDYIHAGEKFKEVVMQRYGV